MKPKEETARPLTGQELKRTKEGLMKKRKALWQEIADDLEKDAREGYGALIDTIRDTGDVALAELQESTVFSLIELKYNELKRIEEAIQRIDDGEYGRCMDCEEWINPARLEIMPHAVRCTACQERWERVSA
jgi:DnaK suppressor protein